MTNLMSESSSVIFYAKCGIGKLIKRWLGVDHDTVLFSSLGEAVKSAKMYYWSKLCMHLLLTVLRTRVSKIGIYWAS